jgi:hypothetical protein
MKQAESPAPGLDLSQWARSIGAHVCGGHPAIGLVGPALTNDEETRRVFESACSQFGWAEGRNIHIVYRSAGPSQMRAVVAELKESSMFHFHRFAVLLAPALIGTLLMPSARASAFELSGAWATEPDLCNRIFTKKGNQVVFAELSDLFGSGFVVDGNRIRGKAARCMITSRKQDGETLELSAACATSIMNQNVKFNLKVVDDNNLVRLFPDIPGMDLKYTR